MRTKPPCDYPFSLWLRLQRPHTKMKVLFILLSPCISWPQFNKHEIEGIKLSVD